MYVYIWGDLLADVAVGYRRRSRWSGSKILWLFDECSVVLESLVKRLISFTVCTHKPGQLSQTQKIYE